MMLELTQINLTKLQENLVRSHACGTGDLFQSHCENDVIERSSRLVMVIVGFTLETVERLVAFYNQRYFTLVYTLKALWGFRRSCSISTFGFATFG